MRNSLQQYSVACSNVHYNIGYELQKWSFTLSLMIISTISYSFNPTFNSRLNHSPKFLVYIFPKEQNLNSGDCAPIRGPMIPVRFNCSIITSNVAGGNLFHVFQDCAWPWWNIPKVFHDFEFDFITRWLKLFLLRHLNMYFWWTYKCLRKWPNMIIKTYLRGDDQREFKLQKAKYSDKSRKKVLNT